MRLLWGKKKPFDGVTKGLGGVMKLGGLVYCLRLMIAYLGVTGGLSARVPRANALADKLPVAHSEDRVITRHSTRSASRGGILC